MNENNFWVVCEGQVIYADKHTAVTGNPNCASSQRMQAHAQRSVNREERISNGMKSGPLTNCEAGLIERGQAHVTGAEAKAAAYGGGANSREQAGIRYAKSRNALVNAAVAKQVSAR